MKVEEQEMEKHKVVLINNSNNSPFVTIANVFDHKVLRQSFASIKDENILLH